jgi:MFS family permease
MSGRERSELSVALAILIVLFAVYNSNGREIGNFDSQPNKLAAREFLLRGTLSLNHVVGRFPPLADRYSFVLDRQNRYRSAYSPVPAILAAAIAWPFWQLHLLDIRAPGAPAVIAVLAASIMTSLSVALAYLIARTRTTRRRAILLAIGLGLGTGYWTTVSRTLWVHETAIFGLTIAVLALMGPEERLSVRRAAVAGAGLALAGTARPQLAPMIAVLLGTLFWRATWRSSLIAVAIVGVACALLMIENYRWFGYALGPVSQMTAVNNELHRTSSSFRLGLEGFGGLLVSPSRGLFVFSPIVLIALAGVRLAIRESWRSPLRACALAAGAQYVLYSTYAVWWGGHTYGPRYMLDVMPVMVPLAAAALEQIRFTALTRGIVGTALAWSIAVSALGAFCYPNDQWNVDPDDVDRHHARLWSWSDTQIRRCLERGPSPQNFNLFNADAFTVPPR